LNLPEPVEGGNEIRCPECKSVFRVPEESEVVDMDVAENAGASPKRPSGSAEAVTRSRPAQARDRDDDEANVDDAPPPVRKARKKGMKPAKDNAVFAGLVAALVGAVLAVGIYLIAKTTAGKEKKPPQKQAHGLVRPGPANV
jgi:hypothetical protein